jgi:DNA-binding NarL/FixJ family response regulator
VSSALTGGTGIRVVLGEDSFLAREGIVRALELADGVDLVGVCGDLGSLRATVEAELPDVVLTDIRMPPTKTDEGLQLASELRATHPDIGVVVLSQHAEPEYASMLFEDGPEGRAYLLKESLRDQSELVRALQTVAGGGSVVDPLIVQRLLVAQRQRRESALESLTPRELEILGLIAEGRSNAAIAAQLVVTKRAVERHINSIFLKLGLRDSENVSRRVKAALLYLSGDGADGG